NLGSSIGSRYRLTTVWAIRSATAGTGASYCISYSDILGSEPYVIRVGYSLSQGLFEFWREWHTQTPAGSSACDESSFTDPAINHIRRDPEPGCKLFHTELVRSEGLQLVDVVGVTE